MLCEWDRNLESSSFILHSVLQPAWSTELMANTQAPGLAQACFPGVHELGGFLDGHLGLQISHPPLIKACFREGFSEDEAWLIFESISGRRGLGA